MKPLVPALTVIVGAVFSVGPVPAAVVLGTGTGALLGGDLTDPEGDGTPDGMNYNAVFDASEEASFGAGEAAFNVFNNQVGASDAKWCCGDADNFPANPIWVQATFDSPIVLSHFTLTSGNDTPGRRPVDWEIQGSNDGTTFVPIFTKSGPGTAWTANDQVIRWDGGGVDFATPEAYSTIRLNVTSTNVTTGARFQLSEFEIFAVPEPAVVPILGLAVALGLTRRRRNRAA